MIPDYNPDNGFLPIGIHEATWAEFYARYGYTKQRRDLMDGLLRAINDLKSCGCGVIYADGGFITRKALPPKDIDVCWDTSGVDEDLVSDNYPVFLDSHYGRREQKAKYGCEFFPADWIEGNSGEPFLDFFQKYYGMPKGIIKINIEYL